jgi:DNA-binding XRE family transcriptional regulator
MPKDIVASIESQRLYKACMDVIREEREALGYSKLFAAQSCNISIDSYSRYEWVHNPMTPDLDIWLDLCKAVHLPPETVFTRARHKLNEDPTRYDKKNAD